VFDVSFSELLVIAVVALLVIGPEKLPKVARTVGAFTGRMQRYMAQIKEEVNREMRFEELQKLQQEIKASVETAQSAVNQEVAQIQSIAIKSPKVKASKSAVKAPVKKRTKPTPTAK
jgi:sec-independent protein translocase protein TatB